MVLGVDDHQRVQELLLRLPADTEDSTLGNALVAVFASSPEEQSALRKIFATSLAFTNQILAPAAAPEEAPEMAPPTPGEVKQEIRDRRKLLWAGVPLLLILFAVVAYYLQPRTTSFAPQTLTLRVGEERVLPNLDALRRSIGTLQSFDYKDFSKPSNGVISLRDDTLYYYAEQEVLPDSACLLIHGTWNRRAEITIHFRLDILAAAPKTLKPETEKAEIDFSPLPLPYSRSLADLAPQPVITTALDRFMYRWWWPIVFLFFAGCLVFIFFLLRFQHRRNQRLVARRDRLAGAPHFWQISVPDAEMSVDFGETYPLLLRQLRQRREADHQVLDVGRTIDATIQNGGISTFAYKGSTRPAEYLLLIDRSGTDNHRAQLFDLLYQRLRGEEVLIERYFYDGDPHLLYQDDRGNSTTLARLRDRLPNTQLVLVGTGDQLLNASNGKPSAWATKQLATWGRPSLLTPRPHNAWGRRERRLDELLNILPATIQGLGLLTNRLTDTATSSEGLTDYRLLLEDLVQEPIHFSGDLISSLREVYDETKLKWIAACALYPSIHWELTLYLGAKTSELVSQELLTSRNVLELCRLPWFVQGTIPEPARIALTEWLWETYPEEERKLRTALLLALNQAEPPEGSVAHQELSFHRLQNEWMLAAPNSPERARAADQIGEAIDAGAVPDATVVKYLNEPLGRFDIPLDDKWKKRLYPGGLPGLGLHWWINEMLFIGLIALPFYLSFAALIMPEIHENEICQLYVTGLSMDGNFRDLPSDTIAVCSKEDSIELREILFRHIIRKMNGQPQGLVWKEAFIEVELGRINADSPALESDTLIFFGIDTMLNAETANGVLTKQVYANLSVAFYNRGVELLASTDVQPAIGNDLILWAHKLNPGNEAADILADYFKTNNIGVATSRQKFLEDNSKLQIAKNEVDRVLKGKKNWRIGLRFRDEFEQDALALQSKLADWETVSREMSKTGEYAPEDDLAILGFLVQSGNLILKAFSNASSEPPMQTIPAGTFQMGDTFGEGDDDELPVHEVTLSAFELARYELTFEEYDLYCDSTGVEKPDDEGWGRGRRPVINVSWYDAVKYCNWLSEKHGYVSVYAGIDEEEVTANRFANGYRLPTEAEWEYATQSGGKKHRFGNGRDTLRSSGANFDARSNLAQEYSKLGVFRGESLPVGSFESNQLDLADMSGNVFEWCWDWYDSNYYEKSGSNNPSGADTGSIRVIRGGSWNFSPADCRATFRDHFSPASHLNYVGFRLARNSR
jgi:formylglycine-generating enzyme required for sulfatase activity